MQSRRAVSVFKMVEINSIIQKLFPATQRNIPCWDCHLVRWLSARTYSAVRIEAPTKAGLGKSHEAMLVITQKWLEGQRRILLAVPNADLLFQWAELFDKFYSVPYVVLSNRENGTAH